jgi:acetoacetyl-CoA synthetase
MTDVPLWSPSPARAAATNLACFETQVRPLSGAAPGDYAALHRWSVEHPEEFWPAVWRFGGVIADERAGREPWDAVLEGGRMAPVSAPDGPRWFRGARLNFAENLLRFDDDRPALVAWNEQGRQSALTYADLQSVAARAAAALVRAGVRPGDRVAGFLPNIPAAVIAMLAATRIGAIWSSCSPDFGAKGVLDRFGQIRPTVLVAADGYRYAGKVIDSLPRVREIAAALPELRQVVVVPYLNAAPDLDGLPHARSWDAWLSDAAADPAPPFDRGPFDRPVYVLYSSGTTGLPKCLVHGAGGTLLQHLKEHQLHTDLRRTDVLFYFTTCGWMMWNWLVSGLAVGATLVLYDGAPLAPRPGILWEMAEQEHITVFGTSAKYLAVLEQEGVVPRTQYDLSALRTILSTGSPLSEKSYEFVHRDIKADVHLASISGGTDIVSCFALGHPGLPVWKGELQVPGLGMAVDVFDAEGRPISGEPGELVCTRPFPSMPVAFWDDADAAKYTRAYFARFPDTWTHGDWVTRTSHGGLVIHGRSDATLNPGGVRIGTAEIYRQVEQFPEVVESVVIGQEWDGDVRVVLFVRLRDGLTLDETLERAIRTRLRAEASPHHVPKVIVQVPDIPKTLNGKTSEIAVREMVHGRPVTNRDALANAASLESFRDLPALRA